MPIGAVDLAVLFLYLAGAVALGLAVGRGQRDLSGYLLGGRHLPWWAVLGSIVATETSTATFLSVPGLAYARETGDLRFLQLPLGYVLGRLVVSVLLLPRYFEGRLFSAYQVLRERFGGATQRAASAVFLVTRTLGDALRLFLTAVALEALLGWPIAACVALIGAATIAYTVFGGMRSIVWNDCVQLVVYVTGGVVVLGVTLARLPGGLDQVLAFGAATGRLRVLDLTPTLADPFVLWAGLFGGAVLTLGTHGTDQMMVQRLLSAPSRAAASRALVTSGFVVLVQFALFLFLGLALACYDDVFRPGREIAQDRALATFLVEELPQGVGLIGLLLAAVFAAAMSTLSSSLNASAASVVEDWIVPARGAKQEEARLLRTTRWLTVLFGLVQIAIAIAAADLSRSVVTEALAIAGFSAGLLLGVFLLGALVPRASQAAALTGLACGLTALLAVKFVLPAHGIEVAWPWFAAVGAGATVSGGATVSAWRASAGPSAR